MTTLTYTTKTENTAPIDIDRHTLSSLITCPVGPDKARLLLGAFRQLGEYIVEDEDHLFTTDTEAFARQCRYSAFILDNLSWKDAADYSRERDAYSQWFHDDRKKLSQQLTAEADRLHPQEAAA